MYVFPKVYFENRDQVEPFCPLFPGNCQQKIIITVIVRIEIQDDELDL